MIATLVFGGTFDPPHRVHVAVASQAADLLKARRLVVVPAARNPLRVDHRAAPPEDRLAMVRLAFADVPRCEVLDLELRRPPPSYTIETLRDLDRRGAAPMRLLIGSDQALDLPRWRAWREIVALAPPAIVLRPPHDAASYRESVRRLDASEVGPTERGRLLDGLLPLDPVDMRSTDIREALARVDGAESTSELDRELDPRVRDYIRSRLLYHGR